MDERKTVLITGCSQGGIGFALAREFHRRGLRVFATARDLKKMQLLHGDGIETLQLDVTDKTSLQPAVDSVSQLTGGRLDILVNNAGSGYKMPLLDADLDEARRLLDVNVWGVLAVTQACVPLLRASAASGGQPRIVNIGSVTSQIPVPWQGVYNASKAALFTLSDTLRLELRPLDIDVLHIVTGAVATNFHANESGKALPKGSIYLPVAAQLGRNVQELLAGERSKFPPEEYARKVVANVLSSRPSATMWIGGMSLLCWFSTFFGLDGFRDRVIERLWGMRTLKLRLDDAAKKERKE